MKNIAVLFGGVSSEHDISVITGVLTLNCIDRESYNPIPIYVRSDGRWLSGEPLRDISYYKSADFKRCAEVTLLPWSNCLYSIKKNKLKRIAALAGAINCMHGANGEDGSIAGILQLCKIPLASPSMLPSAVAMDKVATKIAMKGLGVRTVDGAAVIRREFFSDRESAIEKIISEIGLPAIVKPANCGSSIGISTAKDETSLERALELAFKYDGTALCEKYVSGVADVNCAAYSVGGEIVVSECEKPVTAHDILTFDDKYRGSKSGLTHEFPANISGSAREQIRAWTALVYKKLGFSGIVRIDYLLVGDEVYLNEINSIPGSLAYYLFSERTAEFSSLLNKIIAEGIREGLERQSNVTEFASSVLRDGFTAGVKK